MSIPIGFDRAAIDALGWTLMHFIWQGALIALGFAVLERGLGRASANARYVAACGTLLLMLAVPTSTFVVLRDAGPGASSSLSPSEAPTVAAVAGPLARLASPRIATPGPDRVAPAPQRASWAGLSRDALTRWMPPARRSAWSSWLVMAWGIGVLAFSIRLLGGWWLVRRLRSSGGNATLAEWEPRLRALSRRLGVTRPVRLLRSVLVQVPTVIGWLHPVILVPASTLTGLSPAQIESILAHELAHVRRHDYLVNLLQSLVETLLFYHPGVWWVSRRVREERELCCDDLAVAITGDPVVYAEALVRLECLRGQPAKLAVAASGGSLLARVARLVGAQPDGHEQGARGPAVGLGILLVMALMIAQLPTSPGGGVGVAAVGSIGPRASLSSPDREAPVVAEAGVAATAGQIAPIEALLGAQLAAISELTLPSVAPAIVSAGQRLLATGTAVTASAPVLLESGDNDQPEGASPPSFNRRLPYTVDEWIQLTHHGVDVETYARYAAAGLDQLPADELIALVNNGIEPEYVAQMRRGGLETNETRDLIRLSQHGVTPEFVASLRDLGARGLSTEELIRLVQNDVSPEWFAAMRWMGYPGLTVDRAIRLSAQGISPEFASQLKVASRRRFSLDELERMSVQGVSAEYAARMDAVLPGVGSDDLIRLMNQGVEPDYVAPMQVAGPFEVDELIALHQQGVTAEFIFVLAASGYDQLSAADLIRLYQNGVDGEFAAQAAEAGFTKLSVSELIRLNQQGLPCTKGE